MIKLYKNLLTAVLTTGVCFSAEALSGFYQVPEYSMRQKAASSSPTVVAVPLNFLDFLKEKKQKEVLSYIRVLPNAKAVTSSSFGLLPLWFFAVDENNTEAVELFLARGVDIDQTGPFDSTALTRSISTKHKDMIQLLLSKGANPDFTKPGTIYGDRPIQAAAKCGDADIFKLIWGACKNKLPVHHSGSTLMHFAAEGGNTSILEFLKDQGLSCTSRDLSGFQPIHKAAREGHMEAIRFLTHEGADVNAIASYDTPLTQAVRKGELGLVKFLIEEMGAKLEQTTPKGTFMYDVSKDAHPLGVAASSGDDEMVGYLLSKGARTDVTFEKGKTALMEAVSRGHNSVARFLIGAGADPHQVSWRRNALHEAVEAENVDAVKMLVAKNVNRKQRDDDGFTPLKRARYMQERLSGFVPPSEELKEIIKTLSK